MMTTITLTVITVTVTTVVIIEWVSTYAVGRRGAEHPVTRRADPPNVSCRLKLLIDEDGKGAGPLGAGYQLRP